MKRREYVFIGVIMLSSIVWFIGSNLFMKMQSGQVQITVDGKEYGIYSLNEAGKIQVETGNGYNIIEIDQGEARVTDADCPDLLCVKMHAISKENQVICCLPHRVVVRVISDRYGEENDIDSETY